MDQNFLFLVLKNWSFFMLLLLGKINFAMIEDTSTAFLLLPYSAFPSSTLLLLVLSLSWWSPIDSKDSCISCSATVSKKKAARPRPSWLRNSWAYFGSGFFSFWDARYACVLCVYIAVLGNHIRHGIFFIFLNMVNQHVN